MTVRKKRRKKVSSKSKRRGIDINKARKQREDLDSRSASKFHDIKQGWNYFFILPPWSDENVAWKEVVQHGFAKGNTNCAKAMAGESCGMCKELAAAARKGDSEKAERLRLSSRGFFNSIKKANIKGAGVEDVKVLRTSAGVFGEILEYVTDEDVDITDPTAAIPVGIKKTGEKLKTRYKVRFGSPVDISDHITDEILESLFDLDTLPEATPANPKEQRKALRQLLRGADDEDDDGDDDGFADDSDDDEDDELDDEDDVEDELFGDDEGSDEESEDEEGEERPRKKKAKKKVTKKTKKKVAKKVRRRRE